MPYLWGRLSLCYYFSCSDDHNLTTPKAADIIDKQLEQLTISETETTSTLKGTKILPVTWSGPHYPAAFLQAVEEPADLQLDEGMSHARDLLKKYQSENPEVLKSEPEEVCRGKNLKAINKGKVSGDEGYEKALPKHGDRAFRKFQKQLAKCPQQLLRYVLLV